MRGKTSHVSPLQARKKLLLAESELNRNLMVHEWEAMTDEARAVAVQAGTMGSLASNAASLVAGLAAFQGKRPIPVLQKLSWLNSLLKGGGIISTLWFALRAKRNAASKNPKVG